MKKKNQTPEYGKPYTPKDFRDVGVGLVIGGIIAIAIGVVVFQNGAENQIVLTKAGNEMHGSDPQNPLYLWLSIVGMILTVTGLAFWIRGKKADK